MPKKKANAKPKKNVVETQAESPVESQIEPAPEHQKSRKWLLAVPIILILVAAGGYFAYKYYETKQDVDRLSNPQVAAQEQKEQWIEDVGKLVELPAGEDPLVGTVSDATKLQNQAIFARAQNGDRVLIYTQAKKVYIYRPSTGKIVDTASNVMINTGEKTSEDSKTDTPETP